MILAAAFDADGTRLYSGSVDGLVNVWDIATGELLESRTCHDGPILDIRRAPDGHRLLSASKDRTAAVWDAEDGTLVHRLSGHGGGVFCVAASDGCIATGSYDGLIRLWDSASGKLLGELSGHTEAVTTLAFVSAKRLISGSRDRSVRLWDLERRGCEHILEAHRHWVTKIRTLGDGRRALSAGEDAMCNLWDCDTAQLIWSRTPANTTPIWGLDVAPSGAFAISGSGPTYWKLSAGESAALPRMSHLSHRAIAISLDDGLAALGCDDGNIYLYDVAANEVVGNLLGAALGGLSLAAGNDARVATGRADGTVTLHLSDGSSTTLSQKHERFVYAMCRVGEDRFASGAFDGMVRIWKFADTEMLCSLSHDGLIFALAASADGRHLLSAGGDAVRLWDVEGQSLVLEISAIGSGTHTVADLAPDMSLIVSAGEDDALRCWTARGALQTTLRLDEDCTSAVKLLPDARRAVVGSAYGRVSLVDLDSGKIERLHQHHEDWIRELDVSSDGRFVASVSQDCDCCLYDLKAQRLLTLDALAIPIPAAAFDVAGNVAALTADGDILRLDPSGN